MRYLLVAPPECGGLPEAFAAFLARLAPAAPLGAWMLRINVLFAIASLAMFALLAHRALKSVLVVAVVTTAMAMILRPVLSPFATVGVLAAVLALGSTRSSIAGLLIG